MEVEQKINEIIERIRTGVTMSPATAAEYHRIVTGQYAFLSQFYIELLERKAETTSLFRKTEKAKSEAEAQRLFDLSQDGKKLLSVTQNMRTMEKMMSTLKLTAETEQRSIQNQSHHT